MSPATDVFPFLSVWLPVMWKLVTRPIAAAVSSRISPAPFDASPFGLPPPPPPPQPARAISASKAASVRRVAMPPSIALPGRALPSSGQVFLAVLVFVVGMASLGAEIAAVRLLAPYFGASTIVWANTIGVVLVALAAGYWLGGRAADRRPQLRSLCSVALVAAALLAAVPFVARPLLDVGVEALDDVSAGAFAGSLAAGPGLVAIPVLLLGAVSPWALRLAVRSVEAAGTVAGRLYAISTAGSLIGTLFSALVLIPAVGTRRTFLTFAVLLALVAAAGLLPARRYLAVPARIGALPVLPAGSLK